MKYKNYGGDCPSILQVMLLLAFASHLGTSVNCKVGLKTSLEVQSRRQ